MDIFQKTYKLTWQIALLNKYIFQWWRVALIWCKDLCFHYTFHREVFSNLNNTSQVIQHNKICLNKYLCIENQVKEEEAMKKVFYLIYCCDEF